MNFLEAAKWIENEYPVRRKQRDLESVYRADADGHIWYIPAPWGHELIFRAEFELEDILADDWVYVTKNKDGQEIDVDEVYVKMVDEP